MNAVIQVDFSKWPELIHAIRHEVYRALSAEAERSEPAVAEALLRVAAKVDAGLTDVAESNPGAGL